MNKEYSIEHHPDSGAICAINTKSWYDDLDGGFETRKTVLSSSMLKELIFERPSFSKDIRVGDVLELVTREPFFLEIFEGKGAKVVAQAWSELRFNSHQAKRPTTGEELDKIRASVEDYADFEEMSAQASELVLEKRGVELTFSTEKLKTQKQVVKSLGKDKAQAIRANSALDGTRNTFEDGWWDACIKAGPLVRDVRDSFGEISYAAGTSPRIGMHSQGLDEIACLKFRVSDVVEVGFPYLLPGTKYSKSSSKEDVGWGTSHNLQALSNPTLFEVLDCLFSELYYELGLKHKMYPTDPARGFSPIKTFGPLALISLEFSLDSASKEDVENNEHLNSWDFKLKELCPGPLSMMFSGLKGIFGRRAFSPADKKKIKAMIDSGELVKPSKYLEIKGMSKEDWDSCTTRGSIREFTFGFVEETEHKLDKDLLQGSEGGLEIIEATRSEGKSYVLSKFAEVKNELALRAVIVRTGALSDLECLDFMTSSLKEIGDKAPLDYLISLEKEQGHSSKEEFTEIVNPVLEGLKRKFKLCDKFRAKKKATSREISL